MIYRDHTITLEKDIYYAIYDAEGKYQESGFSLDEAKRYIDWLLDEEEGSFIFDPINVASEA